MVEGLRFSGARSVRHRSAKTAIATGIAALALLVSDLGGARPPLVIYNASASAPIGFYRVLPAPRLARGELILARPPQTVRSLAAERGYLPADVPLVKRVAALSGDTVCAAEGSVAINGTPAAVALAADGRGRPLPAWSGCRVLRADETFLLMAEVRDSFDSRYFGPVSTDSVIGKLVPL
jgi:conjugative transfer signal peptidase TraF